MQMIETQSTIVDIKITYRCNNLCRFCVAGDKREAFPDLSLEQITDIIRSNRAHCTEIVLTGGEPTLHPDFLEIVRMAREDFNYQTVQIQSNGKMFVYKDFCEKLVGLGANEFAISVHGHCADLHDYLTKCPGSFAATISGIRNLLAMKMPVATNTVITKSNYRHLPQISAMLAALGLRQFMFSYPHIIGECERNMKNMAPCMTLVAPYVKKALARADTAGRISLTEAIPPCMLRGYEHHIMEKLHSKRTVVDWNERIDDFFGHRRNYMKQQGPQCTECKLNEECEGVWPDYAEYFSWKEFKPRK